MAGLTLKQIRNDIRSRVNDEELKLGDSLLNHWINIGQDVVINKLSPVLSVHPNMTATEIKDLTSGINEYPLPAPCKQIKRLKIKYTNEFKKATEKNIDEIDSAVESSFGATTTEPLFLIWNNSVEIYPVPTNTVTKGLRIDFIKQKVMLTQDTDISIIPEEYQGFLVDYVETIALRKLERIDQANNNEQIMERMYSDVIGAKVAEEAKQKEG